jgi:2-polyprenyl-3-methyl-5-hydroxy-6-metoxy-1,4-benzoquinol methylase
MINTTEETHHVLGVLVQHAAMLQNHIRELHHKFDALVQVVGATSERFNRLEQDMFLLQDPASIIRKPSPFRLSTEYPVAVESHDHIFPLGTAQDNTRYPRFIARCEEVLGEPLRALDLGCAGGGLVLDFLSNGHEAMGLEGSDYPKKNQQFQWRWLRDRLFTCDITKSFTISNTKGDQASFDVISMWEVLEHIEERDLSHLFDNIKKHLSSRGIFCASVATFECADPVTGAVWHKTVKPKSWWHEQLRKAGLKPVDGLFTVRDFPRGSGNGPQDWDELRNPEMGFHIVATHDS